MALKDVTAEGVNSALAEFDQLGRKEFLDKYSFGRAKGYFLVQGRKRYDSKAIVGAAHGYDLPDQGPLPADGFSGGEATVARLLESLGFEVQRPPRNPPWTEEELILALDVYLHCGAVGKKHPEVLALSRTLKSLDIHSKRPDRHRFRNPNGVGLKLANFAALDPGYDGVGMVRGGKRDAEVWDKYSTDMDALADTAAAIREGGEPPTAPVSKAAGPRVTAVDIEEPRVERFRVTVPRQDRMATPGERQLVARYEKHLKKRCRRVKKHQYDLPDSSHPLECDLVDETRKVLYEAKGDTLRTSVRMAIGQLLDYRRFETDPEMTLAVLLPRQPTPDLIELIHTVPASVVWATERGFETSEPPDPKRQ